MIETRVKTQMTVFWDVAPCSLLKTDRRFGGAYSLHHQGDKITVFWDVAPCSLVEIERLPWWHRQYAPLKRRSISTRLHGATFYPSSSTHISQTRYFTSLIDIYMNLLHVKIYFTTLKNGIYIYIYIYICILHCTESLVSLLFTKNNRNVHRHFTAKT
jgi:hypothetical protein